MRYIDSGTRDPGHAVATWLQAELAGAVTALRIQSGFFSRDALRPFLPRLAALLETDALMRVVVGSNDGLTLASHVTELAQALGLPRERSALGVVYLSGAFFHPKTFHFQRADGSQTAYVGSANFTLPGIAAKHIEAGVLLDSREGDPDDMLTEIAEATDAWLLGDRGGVELVHQAADVEGLLTEGILRATPPPRVPRAPGPGGQPPARPAMTYLVNLVQPQQVPVPIALIPQGDVPVNEDPEENLDLSIAQHTPPYPPYMYFAPGAVGPTTGAAALSGFGLGAPVGLIVRLSRDNDRHWRNAVGTANLNIPTSAASSIRFGFYGERNRPRAEFDFYLRYVDDDRTIAVQPERTGLMSFGYTPGDVGHGDLRLVIPKSPVKPIQATLVELGLRLPQANDLAMLQWPTPNDPTFRMTVTNPDSILGQEMWGVWQNAASNSQLASRGSCWLPAGLGPPW